MVSLVPRIKQLLPPPLLEKQQNMTESASEHGLEDLRIKDSEPTEAQDISEDDDFGEFGEFDEAEPDESNGSEASSNNTDTINSEKEINTNAIREGPVPFRSKQIGHLTSDEIRQVLVPLAEYTEAEDDDVIRDGAVPTSHQLWEYLTEPTWMPIPKWEGSAMHRQLALSLGVPLNLDASLPKIDVRKMSLPILTGPEIIAGSEDAHLLTKLPDWILLSDVSTLALQSMSEEELNEHIKHLEKVLSEANSLKDTMESKEMDLMGEKNILEGMVESLLVFSHRNQRQHLKNRVTKDKK